MHFSSMNFNWAHSSKSSEFVVDKNIPVKPFKICHVYYTYTIFKTIKSIVGFRKKKLFLHIKNLFSNINFRFFKLNPSVSNDSAAVMHLTYGNRH